MSISATSATAAPLTVRTVPDKETAKIVKVTKEWIAHVEEMQSISLCDSVIGAKLRASAIITGKIKDGLENGVVYNGNVWDKVLVCEDDEVETIALVDQQRNKLVYLVTNPKNILGFNPVRGAAREIILELIRESLKSKKDLRLSSTAEAEGFYLKFGFETDNHSCAFKPLILTVARIEQLIEAGKPPFDRIKVKT